MKYYVLIIAILLSSCSSTVIMKNCKWLEDQDDDRAICERLAPWE
jgi:hypothetical protein